MFPAQLVVQEEAEVAEALCRCYLIIRVVCPLWKVDLARQVYLLVSPSEVDEFRFVRFCLEARPVEPRGT